MIATLIAVLSMAIAITGTSTANAGKPKCTIKGTKGPDRLHGTKGRDVICGFAGNDVIWGLKGDDVIYGGRGDDEIRAGRGNDRLFGQPDDDSLYAGLGNDYLDGGRGRNSYYAGPGENRCRNTETDTVTPGCDDTAPSLAGLEVLNPEINTENEDAWVRFTFRVTDDLSGLRREPSFSVVRPGTDQWQMAWVERTSGDRMDGTYSAQILMPHYAAQGHWTIRISFADRQGNETWLEGKDLKKLGLPDGFDQVGLGDSADPVIHSISVDRSSVDTSTGPQPVTFTIRVTDDASGIPIEQFNAVDATLEFTDKNQQFMAGNFTRISGTDTDGIYQGTVNLPQYIRKGTLTMRVQAIDRAGNGVGWTRDDLKNRGFPYQVTQTGQGDSEPPEVIEFSVTPDQVDTTDGPAVVTVHVRVTDNLSGVDSVTASALPSFGSGFGEFLTRVSGDRLDGTYEGTIEIPDGTATGPIRIRPAVNDAALNWPYIDDNYLTDRGFDFTVDNAPTS